MHIAHGYGLLRCMDAGKRS